MSVLDELRELLNAAEAAQNRPHGPALADEERKQVGEALVSLRGGDADTARTAWRLIVEGAGGYMPAAAGHALVVAANPNLVPDVTPEGDMAE